MVFADHQIDFTPYKYITVYKILPKFITSHVQLCTKITWGVFPKPEARAGEGKMGSDGTKRRQTVSVICCVTLDKLLKLSELQFPHLPNDNRIYHTDLLCM